MLLKRAVHPLAEVDCIEITGKMILDITCVQWFLFLKPVQLLYH